MHKIYNLVLILDNICYRICTINIYEWYFIGCNYNIWTNNTYYISFSNNQHISIIGNRCILINKNITTTTFEFISGDISNKSIYIRQLPVSIYIIANPPNIGYGNIIFFKNNNILFNNQNINYIETNSDCSTGSQSSIGILTLYSLSSIATISGSIIEYYGNDLSLSSTSIINSSQSTSIIISEKCSSTYSMTIGGTQTPQNNQTYNMSIFQTELSSLSVIFNSSNGIIYFVYVMAMMMIKKLQYYLVLLSLLGSENEM